MISHLWVIPMDQNESTLLQVQAIGSTFAGLGHVVLCA